MKLFMKQKAFSWRDKFTIWNEQLQERWFAQGEFFSWGRKLHIFDAHGREVAFVRKKLVSFLPKYYIELDGKTYSLVKAFTLFKPRFYLEGANWTISGNFLAHEYNVSSGGLPIMSISKHWLTIGDSYELNIPQTENELLALCVALAIDCINADASSS
jgi:uncharacterized protein YxjI